jgi:hypothetical protein
LTLDELDALAQIQPNGDLSCIGHGYGLVVPSGWHNKGGLCSSNSIFESPDKLAHFIVVVARHHAPISVPKLQGEMEQLALSLGTVEGTPTVDSRQLSGVTFARLVATLTDDAGQSFLVRMENGYRAGTLYELEGDIYGGDLNPNAEAEVGKVVDAFSTFYLQ